MLSVYVCDDAPQFAAELAGRINNLGGAEKYHASAFTAAGRLRAALESGKTPDIVFMDIEFGGVNGIGLAQELFSVGRTQVVFITNYVDYCSDVYETEHAYFIRKPVTREHLLKALEICRGRLERGSDKVCFKLRSEMACFDRREILFFESSYRKITIHTDGGLTEFYSSIADIKPLLGAQFLQCHKSFVVNLERVSTMERDRFVLDNGEHVPISRGMTEAVREYFFQYLRKG
jgi:DNA-binding LytR/AlgR family response regulator